MVAPVTAPYAPSYAFSIPYLTPAEYMAEPTGVDVSQLIPKNSSPAAQTAALTRVIGRASSWADQYCRKILAATIDVQSGEYRLRSDGTIRVPLDNTPIVQVTGVNVGFIAGRLQPLADLSGIRFRRKTISIPMSSTAGTWQVAPAGGVTAGFGNCFADVSYINGFAHALTANACAAGATSLQLAGTPAGFGVGIVPGLPLTIYDGGANGINTETVVVDSTYVFGSATVPLAFPTLNAHGVGCSVSALPGFARQAVIGFTSALIKTRGSEALVMPAGPGGVHSFKEEDLMPGASEDVNIAMELLEPLRRVW